MKIPSSRMAEYVDEVNAVAKEAAEAAMAAYFDMRRKEPTASIPQIREGAKTIVETVAAAYCAASGELAARMYDELAEAAGADVPEAYVMDMDDETADAIDRAARYHVGALAGDRSDI